MGEIVNQGEPAEESVKNIVRGMVEKASHDVQMAVGKQEEMIKDPQELDANKGTVIKQQPPEESVRVIAVAAYPEQKAAEDIAGKAAPEADKNAEKDVAEEDTVSRESVTVSAAPEQSACESTKGFVMVENASHDKQSANGVEQGDADKEKVSTGEITASRKAAAVASSPDEEQASKVSAQEAAEVNPGRADSEPEPVSQSGLDGEAVAKEAQSGPVKAEQEQQSGEAVAQSGPGEAVGTAGPGAAEAAIVATEAVSVTGDPVCLAQEKL